MKDAASHGTTVDEPSQQRMDAGLELVPRVNNPPFEIGMLSDFVRQVS